jgi:hypothetical protein
LFGECVLHLIEGHRAKRRVVDVRRNRQRLVGWPDGSRDEPRLLRRRPLVGGLLRKLCGLEVQLVHERLERVISLSDRRPAERIRLDDIGAGFEVLLVNPQNDVGTRQHEHVVVAAQLFGVRFEAFATEVRFRQRVALDHRPHRTIQDEDAVGHETFETGSNV